MQVTDFGIKEQASVNMLRNFPIQHKQEVLHQVNSGHIFQVMLSGYQYFVNSKLYDVPLYVISSLYNFFCSTSQYFPQHLASDSSQYAFSQSERPSTTSI
jgi:SPX domain protein involved in polyphosphate accumulation